MKYARIIAVLAAASWVSVAAVAAAQTSSSSGDTAFVQKAAKSGTEEVSEGRVERTSDDGAARRFASRMVIDHTKANTLLSSIARSSGLGAQLEQGIGQAQPAQARPGRNYLRKEVSDHEDAIALFRSEAAHGENPRLRAFARTTLPTLVMHLQLAQSSLRNR
ncbi:MAG TPA: DUF4142 domain-containing protein [Candidatus Baltobacteraceae bacterium]|nr:DUF4142 domain-containing protein [Candidatus Baltobacteraceae bacterium]